MVFQPFKDHPNFLPCQPATMTGHISRPSAERIPPEVHFSNLSRGSRNASLSRSNVDDGNFRKHGVTFEPRKERHPRHLGQSQRDNRTNSSMNTISSPGFRDNNYKIRTLEDGSNPDPDQRIRFHSLDPRSIGCNKLSLATTDARQHSGQNSRTNTMPDPRQHCRRTANGAVDDIDEDYCSGGESGSGKAPMRREYSQWELEQHKNDRRKKLMAL